ncbi:MAG: reductase [Chloroflexi bacterium]|nr:MAG: reductase [Chloroflexota bacterium]
MVGSEAIRPYDRTHLSKGYLTGKTELERLPLRAPEHYRDLAIELELGRRVVGVDVAARRALLDGGQELEWGALLLATGGEPRQLPLPGLEGALYLREIADSDQLRAELRGGGRISIVGAGFIGCEVAAAARELGVEVDLYERFEQPLERVLGRELGAFYADLHRSHGVHLHLGVEQLPKLDRPQLAAVGMQPRDGLAVEAGLLVDAGVLVDATGQTSAPGVYAAGDVARYFSPTFGSHVRVEHFQTAQRHGFAVGRSMAGQRGPFTDVPWFWSDQYGHNLQYAGAGLAWDRIVERGRIGDPPFTVFYLLADRLLAAAAVDDPRTLSRARRLIELGISPPAGVLADPVSDLKALGRLGT